MDELHKDRSLSKTFGWCCKSPLRSGPVSAHQQVTDGK